jgi:large subunit ribosomal protein L21
MDYAVIKTGGKQYRVKPGDTLDVEKLTVATDTVTEFGEVLAISDEGQVTFGTPYVPGAKVLAQVQAQHRDPKIIVFKYKAKTRYRRKRSHRQGYTRLLIQDILVEQPQR